MKKMRRILYAIVKLKEKGVTARRQSDTHNKVIKQYFA